MLGVDWQDAQHVLGTLRMMIGGVVFHHREHISH